MKDEYDFVSKPGPEIEQLGGHYIHTHTIDNY